MVDFIATTDTRLFRTSDIDIYNMKRKHEEANGASNGIKSKVPKTETNIKDRFHSDLFSPKTVKSYKKSYAESTPYVIYAPGHSMP